MAHKIVLGVFDDPDRLLDATRSARESGLAVYDAYVPYAVHGLDEAMGLRRTRLGVVCFVMGLSGLLTAIGFQLWSMAWDWPMIIGGKTFTAFPALIPVTFELTILFGAVGTFTVFLLRAGLWPGKKVISLNPGVTDDCFVLALEASGEGTKDPRAFLEGHQAMNIREVEAGT